MSSILQKLFLRAFKTFDWLGLHVLPKHYYTPVADQHWLSTHKSTWAKRAPMLGVHWDLDDQMAWLERICRPHYGEVAGLKNYAEIVQSRVGPGYGPIESQVLHCAVRSLKPRRIIEIGSGVSTAVMLKAIALNEKSDGTNTEITCIEPYPKEALRQMKGITLVEQICQTAAKSVFAQLQRGDLLFIDSSHALKTGSDLAAIYLEIVPALNAGVLIHIHDIWLPYLYSPSVLGHYFDWQETPLVLALLTNNSKLKARCGLAALQHDRPSQMQEVLADFRPREMADGLDANGRDSGHYVSSLWLETQ
jgi:predicted O-methyltransferase YrrM